MDVKSKNKKTKKKKYERTENTQSLLYETRILGDLLNNQEFEKKQMTKTKNSLPQAYNKIK